MSDDETTSYLARLRLWGLYVAAVLATSIASSLINRWIGVTVQVPPPPPVQIVVTPGTDPGAATITVVSPKP